MKSPKKAQPSRKETPGIFEEITQRKLAEEANARLAAIVESSEDAIVGMNLLGIVTSWNKGAEKVLGYAADEMVGASILRLIPVEQQEENEILTAIKRGETLKSFETVQQTKECRLIDVSVTVSPIRNGAGKVVGVSKVARDITQRKQADEQLRLSKERYSLLVTALKDGIVLQDASGKILTTNPAAERILGLSSDQIEGMDSLDPRWQVMRADGSPFPGEEHPAMVALRTGKPQRDIAMGVRQPGGELTWININSEPIFDPCTPEPHAVVTLFADVTERKQAEEALRASESRFRAIIEASPVPFAMNDGQQNITFLNTAFTETFGYEAADIPALADWWSRAYPDAEYRQRVAADWRKRLGKAAETGAAFEAAEVNIRCKDGTERTAMVGAVPLGEKLEGLHLVVLYDITQRKQAEIALQESEFRWKFAIEGSGDGLWDWNVKEGVVFFSKRWKEMLGYTEAEIGNRCEEWSTRVHPEDLPRAMADVERYFEGKAPHCVNEHRVKGKDGTWKWTLARGVVVSRDSAGKPLRMIGTQTDISEQKKAEEETHFQNRLLNVLLELPQQADQLEEKAFIEFALETAENLTGSQIGFTHFVNDDGTSINLTAWSRRTLDHYCQATYESHYPLDQAGIWADAFRQQKPVVINDYASYPQKRGLPEGHSKLTRLVSLPVMENGRTVMVLGIGNKSEAYSERDVNAIQLVADLVWRIVQRHREAASRLRLATAVEQSAETVVITDTRGTILYANPAFEKISGYTCAEALGQNPRLLKGGKQDDEFYRQMWETLKCGEVWQGHFNNKRKDGSHYEEDATISPIRNNEGTVINYVAVKRDVTREIQLERQFIEAQKMEAIGHLAGGVAHDYNNILAANMMQIDLLLSDPGLTADVKQGLHDLMQGEERAAKLTSQLLMFSRRQAMQKAPVDLNELLNEELKMLRRLLGEHIELAVTAGPGDAWIEADAGMIEQVIMNLCINARDAMPGGGKLSLGIRLVELNAASSMPCVDARPGRFVCLSVADSGCGMSEETQKRIFEPFFTTKEIGQGTGLGMATVYGIVKQHNGWVEVTSEIDKGSEFRVALPAIRVSHFKPASAATPQMAGGTETVLVVEDEPLVRKMLVTALKFNGYQVLEASDGPEALRQWSGRSDEIDVLLTDMVMPGGMTGLELAEAFKKLKPDLPLILMSGYSIEMLKSGLSNQLGFIYLSKPCNVIALTRAVRGAAEGAKLKRISKQEN